MAKKRVLYAAFDVVPGPKGASIHIVHFLRGLVNANYDVTLISPGDGTLPDEDIVEGARVLRVSAPAEDNFLARSSAFSQAVIQHVSSNPGYDFVHFRSIWGGFQLAQAKKQYGYQVIFEVNGLPSVELKYHYPGIQATGLLDKIREQEIATLLLSDAILCPSTVTRSYLVSLGAPEKRVTVIPNGANPSDFRCAPLPAPDDHHPVLLYIGTLADWQGLEVLLKALPAVLAERPARLRIIGRGRSRQRKQLEKHIRKAGLGDAVSIEEAIPHDAIPEVIAAADVCVAPLGYNDRNVVQGCCPIKVIEYMACGRPIVASNLPVVRELVREGVDALLFTPDDPADLAQQIIGLLKDRDLAQKIAASAAQRARSNFTWHNAQKRLIKVYQKLEHQVGG